MIRILHVDDSQTDSEMAQTRLSQTTDDIEITWIGDAQEALKLLEQERYDCILSDFQMPYMDGLQFLKQIREENKDIPFIFFTGQGNEQLAAEALRSGANEYYTKASEIAHYERLANSIKRVVDSARQKAKRRQAETALLQNEKRHRFFFEQANEGIFRFELEEPFDISLSKEQQLDLLNGKAILAECNSSFAQFFNFESSSKLQGITFKELRQIVARVNINIDLAALVEAEHRISDQELVYHDGTTGTMKYLSFNAVGQVEEGKFIRVWGTLREITQQKLVNQELQLNKERFTSLFNLAPDLLYLCDERGAIIETNQAAHKYLGFTKEESIGKNLFEIGILHDNQIEIAQEALKLNVSGKPFGPKELVLTKKNGSSISMEIRSIPVMFEDGLVILGIGRDLTERKKVEKSLFDSEIRYQTLFEESADAILIIKNNQFIDCNRSTVEMLRADNKESVLDTHPSELSPEYQPDGKRSYLKADEMMSIAMEQGSNRFEWLHRRMDGEVFPVEVLLTVIPDKEDKIIHTVWRDITERKKNERELVRYAEELDRQSRNLEDRNKELAAFNYSVSHDLKRPIRQIHGFAEILQVEAGDGLNARGNEVLDKIIVSTRKLNEMVSSLLALSNMSTTVAKNENINLSEIAQTTIDQLISENSNLDITTKIAFGLYATADEGLIVVLLNNLFNNAIKFAGSKDRIKIEFGRLEESGQEIYYVKDNGSGFSDEDAEEIFSPFYRMSNSVNVEGQGIGLATAERIVKKHGGKIWAKSELGMGATFYFTLG